MHVGLIAAIHLAFGLALTGIALLPGWLFYPGITLMVVGFFLRQWFTSAHRRVLRSRSSVSRKGRPSSGKARTVTSATSPTRGEIMIRTWMGLALRSWGAALVLLLASAAVYGYRIRVEEKALVERFGEEYVEYVKETKMLIPFVL